jgi:aconitate hydratase
MKPIEAGLNSFGTRAELRVGGVTHAVHRLDRLEHPDAVARLPYSLKVLLENLLRNEDGRRVTAEQVRALAGWDPAAQSGREISFTPARVLLQDFTGVPCVVDLVAMRDAMAALGGDPQKINPLIPGELVIDHSVITDVFGRPDAFRVNADLELSRNRERYHLLRWAQQAFDGFRVVPPDTGICHQVNLEYLSRVVFSQDGWAYPDTLVGTDSHTPMVNGLGVLGWGVGGIEAEAALLGQPMSMLIPPVLGLRLSGQLPEGSTATDLVLTVTELLRSTGVVGSFVEFCGPGVADIPLATRATLGNMSPEYGATCAIFPIDEETLRYLRLTGRPAAQVDLVEAYAKEQGLWHDPGQEPVYSHVVDLELATVEPSIAGPKRPQDRIRLAGAGQAVSRMLDAERDSATARAVPVTFTDGTAGIVDDGHVVIAAITSCTNTSNPSVMVGAALLAKKAVELGLHPQPWVKTSLAPGSRAVTDYLDGAGLTPYLEKLGFGLVGYGCTTCIGNAGPLIPAVSAAVNAGDLTVAAVLSGNRNFEGRIHAECKMSFLTSPPLVIAYALTGTMRTDLVNEPLGADRHGQAIYLRDIWPSMREIAEVVQECISPATFKAAYADVFKGDTGWRGLEVPAGDVYDWDESSTYIRRAPFFDGLPRQPEPLRDITGAKVLALLGDSVTTDHISPAGAIRADSPAGRYLAEQGVAKGDFNSYGSRRGNHEVMIRGTFANPRLRNGLTPGLEGGFTRQLPGNEPVTIYDAAMGYATTSIPLLVLAGSEYGSGSSRDWAAKGTMLLGVKAVLATSFERIHRSNLIGMGVLPIQFLEGDSVAGLGLTGEETYSVSGLAGNGPLPEQVLVRAVADGRAIEFGAVVRIDTPAEEAYFRHGGILQYVIRQLLE